MKTRYENMRKLSKNLKELFELCGESPKNIRIKESSKIVSFVEALFHDDSVVSFLDDLNSYTLSALKSLQEKQLDYWNSQQDMVYFENLEKENEALKMKLNELEKQCNQMYEQNRKLASEKENPEIPDNSEDNLKIIKDLISMRDTLQARLEWASEALDENDNAVKIINNQIKETGKLLQNAGVKILDDCGSFDSRICTVIQTTPTNDPSLVDTIAQIFRPGYEYRGEMIRSKEVILYAQE